MGCFQGSHASSGGLPVCVFDHFSKGSVERGRREMGERERKEERSAGAASSLPLTQDDFPSLPIVLQGFQIP